MKKYLKKLGVLTLIAAMLAPYISIPSVKAETSSNCTKHLKQYMLLDASKLYAEKNKPVWIERQVNTYGYKTYTNFPFDFPSKEQNKVKILDAKVNQLKDSVSISSFWSLYLEKVHDVSSTQLLEDYGQTFVKFYDSSREYNEFDTVSVVFHGKWSNDDKNGEALSNMIPEDLKKNDANERTLYNLLSKRTGNSSIRDNMKVSLTNAKYLELLDKFQGGTTPITEYYMQSLVDGVNFPKDNNPNIDDYVYYDSSIEQGYFTVKVNREIDLDEEEIAEQLNEYTFGREESNGVYKIYTESASDTEPKNSYRSMINYLNGKSGAYIEFKDANGNSLKPEIDTNTTYYWPAIFSVEYEVCETANTPTTQPSNPTTKPNEDVKYWHIQYTAKTEDAGTVTNLPGKHSEKLGTNSKVASGVPTKEGYAFKGWCVGSETCTSLVKADDTLTSPDKEGTVTLYAQWGEAGPGEQEKTGVMSYVLGLSAVALVAGGIYYVSKKKNLFKQI